MQSHGPWIVLAQIGHDYLTKEKRFRTQLSILQQDDSLSSIRNGGEGWGEEVPSNRSSFLIGNPSPRASLRGEGNQKRERPTVARLEPDWLTPRLESDRSKRIGFRRAIAVVFERERCSKDEAGLFHEAGRAEDSSTQSSGEKPETILWMAEGKSWMTKCAWCAGYPSNLPALEWICSLCGKGWFVAQLINLSVSVKIVAGRDNFVERGSVSRSTLGATDALDL